MKPTVMRSLGAVEPSAPSALEGMMTGAATNVAAVDLRNCRREIWFSFIKELSVRKSLLLPARFIGKGEDDDCVRITPHQSQVRQVALATGFRRAKLCRASERSTFQSAEVGYQRLDIGIFE